MNGLPKQSKFRLPARQIIGLMLGHRSADFNLDKDEAQCFTQALDEAACIRLEGALAALANSVSGVQIGDGPQLRPFLGIARPIGAVTAAVTGVPTWRPASPSVGTTAVSGAAQMPMRAGHGSRAAASSPSISNRGCFVSFARRVFADTADLTSRSAEQSRALHRLVARRARVIALSMELLETLCRTGLSKAMFGWSI